MLLLFYLAAYRIVRVLILVFSLPPSHYGCPLYLPFSINVMEMILVFTHVIRLGGRKIKGTNLVRPDVDSCKVEVGQSFQGW